MAEREELTIRTAGGAVFLDGITLTEYTLTLSRMGMPSLTASVRYKECLDDAWTGDEYVDCMGERYWLRETPTSTKDSTDERYDHELNFVSEREKLAQTYFYDVVTDTGVDYKPITNSTEFKFWGTLKEFVGRLNSALQYAGIGDSLCRNVRIPIKGTDMPVGDGFAAMVDESGDYELDECKELTFENEYIWNAISKAFDTYGVPFAVRGRRIIFGETPIMADCKLEYGADNELLKITKTNQNNLVVRETTGLGSSENIPYYYPNDTEYGTIDVAATEGNAVLTTGMVNVNRLGKLIAKVAEGERLTYRYVTFVESEAMPIGDAGKVWTLTDGYGNATNCKQGGGQGITNVATVPSIQQMGVGMQPECQMRFQFLVRGVSKPKFTLWMRRYKSAQSGTPTDSTAKNMAAQAWAYNAQIIGNGLEAPIGAVKRNNRFEAEDALAPGLYTFTCRLNAYDEETSFSLTSIEIESDGADSSYWECNGQIFRQIGMLGLGINGELGADANGDSIEWTSRDRMTFQTRLVVPKYRNTRGTERFYKALNRVTGEYANAYRAENGVPYVFPNPYREGNPSQHIYEDDSIKPTIEGIRNDEIDPETGLGKLFGEIAAIAYDENDNDSLKSGDEDRDNAEYEHSFFYIKLRRMNYVRNGVDYSLDLFNMASQTDAMTIQMTSGRCAGCKFKIQAAVITRDGLEVWQNPVQASESGEIYPGDQAEKINKRNIQAWQQDTSAREVWVAVQKDTETFGVLMPNRTNQYFPSEGDTFNIINIDLPKCYILDAERRLEKAMMKNMRENNDEKWEFDVEISRVWLAEHKNVLDTLDEYCTIPIIYDGKEYVRYVTALTIECKDKDALPELKLTLAGEIVRNDDFVQKTVAQAVSIVNGLIPKKAPSTKPFVTEITTSTSSVTASSETPQSILDKLKRVDGPQSGLDADTLDGHHAAEFATKEDLTDYAKTTDIPDVSGFLTDYDVKSISVNGGAQQPLKGSGNVDIKAATSIDGSGHITAGNLQADGSIGVGVESGYGIPSNSKQQGWDAAKALLEELFEKVNLGTDSNPQWTIKAKYGLWTEQFLSAKGVGDGSAEGGIDYEAVQEMIAEALQGYNPSTGSIDWDSITGKPSTFAPSAHNHTKADITDFTHSHAIADVTGLQTALNGKVPTSRTITAGTGLSGGGNLTTDRTIKLSDTNVALLAMLSDMFEWDKSKDTTSGKTDSSKWVIKAKASLWTDGYLSAKGTEEGSEGSAIDDINADILDIRAALEQHKAQWQSAVSNANANIVQVSGALDNLNTTVNAIPRVSVDANGKLTIDGTEKKLSYSNLSDKPTIPSVSLSNGTITIDGSDITPLTSHQSLAGYAKTSDIPTLGISDAGVITIGDKTITPYTSSNKPSAADIGARPDTWTPTAADVGVTLSNGSISIGGTSIKPITALRKIKIGSTEYDLTANTGSAAVGITAASVGARASDWMPTAADVGARASDWMPTAADVGARPSNWTPTATEVGVPTWAQAESKPSYTASEVGARASNWMPTASDVGADPAGTAATKASAAETAAKNYADGLLNLRGDGTGGTAATGRFASLKLQLNGSDVDTYSPLASSTKTINVAGVLTTGNYGSYVTRSYIEGLNAGLFDFAYDNNTLLEDWVKATAATRKAGNVFSVNGWAWTYSSNLKLTDSISIDRMRYSAISIRSGNLTSTWNQQAMLFVPTYSDVSNIYLAQMTTGETAGVVAKMVKRYADYDTIMADVGNAYLPKTGGTLTGSLSVSGNVGIGTTSPAYKLDVNGSMRTSGNLALTGDDPFIFLRSGKEGPSIAGTDTFLLFFWHTNSNGWSKTLMRLNSDGKVGVGTDSPAYKLDVNGTISAGAPGEGNELLRFNSERPWVFVQEGAGASTGLALKTTANNKSFVIRAYGGQQIAAFYSADDSSSVTLGNNNLHCTYSGNVGIGTTSPDAKLHVAGAVHATGNITSDKECVSKFTSSSSDERLKRVTGGVDIALRSIAEAPSIRFDWRDGSGKDAGSIAQYWQDIVPEAVRTDSKGYLTMQYGKLALLSAISLARNAVSHEARIAQLEGEVERLKQEVERLSA